jgi:hypothetical protein
MDSVPIGSERTSVSGINTGASATNARQRHALPLATPQGARVNRMVERLECRQHHAVE